jgi:hypothetical protein
MGFDTPDGVWSQLGLPARPIPQLVPARPRALKPAYKDNSARGAVAQQHGGSAAIATGDSWSASARGLCLARARPDLSGPVRW